MSKAQIAAGEFKAHCLKLMDQVATSRTEIVVTKRGHPLVKMVPFDDEAPKLFGFMQGSGEIHGDIIEPQDESWEADA